MNSFQTAISDIRYFENFIVSDNNFNLMPFLYDNYNWRHMDNIYAPTEDKFGPSAFSADINLKILDKLKFENLMDNQMHNYVTKLNVYLDFKSILISLQRLIDLELRN